MLIAILVVVTIVIILLVGAVIIASKIHPRSHPENKSQSSNTKHSSRGWSRKVAEWKRSGPFDTNDCETAAFRFVDNDRRLMWCPWQRSMVAEWDLSSGTIVRAIQYFENPVRSLAFAPNDSYFVTGHKGGSISIWDYHTGLAIKILSAHQKDVSAIAISPDGRIMLSGASSGDRSVIVWDCENWAQIDRIDLSGENYPETWSLEITKDCRRFLRAAGGGPGMYVSVFDLESLRETTRFKSSAKGNVCAAVFHPDGKSLAFVSMSDLLVHVVEAESGHDFNSFRRHAKGDLASDLFDVKFTPDGKYLVSSGSDSAVLLWLATSDKHVGSFLKYDKRHWMHLAIATSGNVIACASSAPYCEIKILSIPEMRELNPGSSSN